jgi:hypothetical protein
MTDRFLDNLSGMTAAEMFENGAIVFILVLGLVMFCRGSSAFSRYFIPIVCATAVLLKIVHWAQNGDEPPFMTPLVSLIATWFT